MEHTCRKCGQTNPTDVGFCRQCGAALSQNASSWKYLVITLLIFLAIIVGRLILRGLE